MVKRIESRPTDGLSYNSTEAKYWDRAGLDKEVERVFDICHGCRLCFNLCPSFPALFDATDRNDGEVRKLTRAETDRVIDLCYGCRLCEIKCPYTPHDGHPFQLDVLALAVGQRIDENPLIVRATAAERDVDNVLRIRKLLYQDGFTIAGARQQLRAESRSTGTTQSALPFPHRQSELKRVRQGLKEILGMLAARPH